MASGMSTTESVSLCIAATTSVEKRTYLHMVFMDVEKAFDRTPRDLIRRCVRKKGVPGEYVKIVHGKQDATQKGETEYFPI